MIETLIDAAGITALTIAGGAVLRRGLHWYAEQKNPTVHAHIRAIPQIDGIVYQADCKTGSCRWQEETDTITAARRTLHDHLVDDHRIQRPL